MPKIVGIGGKTLTGKTSVARYLNILYGGQVVSIAASLKGASLFQLGVLSFFPQKHHDTRRSLQHYASVGRKIDPEMWVQTVLPYIVDSDEFVFIPDIRYLNEIQFLSQSFGDENCLFVYLLTPLVDKEVPRDIAEHESEQLSPSIFDVIVPEKDFIGKIVSCVRAIGRKWGLDPVPRKPKIYIGSNIHLSPNYSQIFQHLQEVISAEGYDVVSPEEEFSEVDWMEWVDTRTLDDASTTLVTSILSVLNDVDAGVFYFDRPSFGGAMEIFTLSLQGKPTVVGVPLTLFYHPWLRMFSKVVWESDTTRFPLIASTLRKLLPPVEDVMRRLEEVKGG